MQFKCTAGQLERVPPRSKAIVSPLHREETMQAMQNIQPFLSVEERHRQTNDSGLIIHVHSVCSIKLHIYS